MKRELMRTIGGAVAAGLLAVSVPLGATACSSGSSSSSSSSDSVYIANRPVGEEYTFKYFMNEDLFYQGVGLKINSDWDPVFTFQDDYQQIDAPEDLEGTPFESMSIWIGLSGQTDNGEAAAINRALFDGSTPNTIENIDTWVEHGVKYTYNVENRDGYENTYYSITGIESNGTRGFAIFLERKDGISDEDWDGFVEAIKYNLSFDPESTMTDSFIADDDVDFSSWSGTGDAASGTSTTTGGSSSTEEGTTSSTSVGSGTYKVGADIPAGEYKLTVADDNDKGYWEVKNSSADDAEIVDNDNFEGSTYLTVTDGQHLKLSGCTGVLLQ